jgi:peptide/nickel transport system permease protein
MSTHETFGTHTGPLHIVADGPSISPLKQGKTVSTAAVGPWRLIAGKLIRQKVAMVAGVIILLLYLVGLFAEFLAPGLPSTSRPQFTYAPPQGLSFFVTRPDGSSEFNFHVKGYKVEIDKVALRRTFVVDDTKVVPIGFFVKGPAYKLWGLIPMSRRLIGPINPNDPMYLLGADRLGRDVLSRLIYGTRVSMSIGLVGVAMSLILGVVLGSISGFFGGWVDTLIQRVIEVVSAMPTIPLWLGLAAAIPLTWSPVSVYFVITIIVSLLGWTSLAREVRGRFLALRSEDFVTAARLDGSSEARLIFRHRDARRADDDRRGNVSLLPWHRSEAACGQLGRAAAGRSKHPHGRHRTLAVDLAVAGSGRRGALVQLLWRRPARRRRPL